MPHFIVASTSRNLVNGRNHLCKTLSSIKRRELFTYCNEPAHPTDKVPRFMSADEAMKVVKSGIYNISSNHHDKYDLCYKI